MALQHSESEFYVHYVGTDKRMDEWVDERLVTDGMPPAGTSLAAGMTGQKRKRKSTISNGGGSQMRMDIAESSRREVDAGETTKAADAPMTEEELDLREHRKLTATRNFDKVNFGQWQIKTW